MIIGMYAVLDHKLSDYRLCIFEIKNEGAIRLFSDAVNDPKHPWHKHPEDYSLWYVGKFDTEKGKVIPETPENLVNALAVKALDKPTQMELLGDKIN